MRLAREKKYAKFCGEWVCGACARHGEGVWIAFCNLSDPPVSPISVGGSFRWGATIRAWQKCKSPEVLFGLLGH